MDVFKKHIELVEAVNNSKTESEHRDAYQRLRGFRDCMEIEGYQGHLMAADNFYIWQDIDRPMCCGVFLDWTPAPVVEVEKQ